MDLVQALTELAPGAEWKLDGTEYSGLVWLDKGTEQPTQQQVSDYIAKNDYKLKIEEEMPTLEEKVDALLDGGKLLDELKAKIEEIKAKYPKPS